jgi:hypothetical protein
VFIHTMTSWSSPLTGPPAVVTPELELLELFELQPLSVAMVPVPAITSALVPAAFKKLRLVVVCDIDNPFLTFPKKRHAHTGVCCLLGVCLPLVNAHSMLFVLCYKNI